MQCALLNFKHHLSRVQHSIEVLKKNLAVNCQEIWDLEINGKRYSLLDFLVLPTCLLSLAWLVGAQKRYPSSFQYWYTEILTQKYYVHMSISSVAAVYTSVLSIIIFTFTNYLIDKTNLFASHLILRPNFLSPMIRPPLAILQHNLNLGQIDNDKGQQLYNHELPYVPFLGNRAMDRCLLKKKAKHW